ncbi:hypothetical protein [Moorena producens]
MPRDWERSYRKIVEPCLDAKREWGKPTAKREWLEVTVRQARLNQ